MSVASKRGTWLLAGTLWALGSGIPAVADDTELFVSNSRQFQSTARPNILFIIDTSGSMRSEVVTQATYNPARLYDGDCRADRVYWRTRTGEPPSCGTRRWFYRVALMCDLAVQAFNSGAGRYTDLMAQYDDDFNDRWEKLNQDQRARDRFVECEDDRGVHGDGSAGAVYASDDQPGQPWVADSMREVPWGQTLLNQVFTVYAGNYLNWYYGPTTISTRLQVVKDVATGLLGSINNINVGLMRFNTSEGGPVVHAMKNIATARTGIVDAINALPASGWTPLSETLYEAGQYYAGRNVDYGNSNGTSYGPIVSVADSRVPGNASVYNSPMEFGCQAARRTSSCC